MMRIKVKVTPNTKKNEIVERGGGFLKVKLHAKPHGGKANQALIDFLSDELRVPKSAIALIKGSRSREKVIEIWDGSEPKIRSTNRK